MKTLSFSRFHLKSISEEDESSDGENDIDITPSGEKGHWLTIGGRPIFIGEPALANKRLSTLQPNEADKGRQVLEIKVKDRHTGEERLTKKYVYSEKWTKATTRYKFAISNDIEKNRDKIEGALENEIMAGKSGAAMATCALVIARTGMRVGQPGNATKNDDGAEEDTYGATTLQRRHVSVDGNKVRFAFKGKSGVDQDITIEDKTIAHGIKAILDSVDQGGADGPLFQKTVGTGKGKGSAPLSRIDISDRFQRFNEHYKPKDFRTAKAMQKAIGAVQEILKNPPEVPPMTAKKSVRKKAIQGVLERIGAAVAESLGNTPSVAVSNYTNPRLVEYTLRELGMSNLLEADELTKLRDTISDPATADEMPILVKMYGKDTIRLWISHMALSLTLDSDPEDVDLTTMLMFRDLSEADRRVGYRNDLLMEEIRSMPNRPSIEQMFRLKGFGRHLARLSAITGHDWHLPLDWLVAWQERLGRSGYRAFGLPIEIKKEGIAWNVMRLADGEAVPNNIDAEKLIVIRYPRMRRVVDLEIERNFYEIFSSFMPAHVVLTNADQDNAVSDDLPMVRILLSSAA